MELQISKYKVKYYVTLSLNLYDSYFILPTHLFKYKMVGHYLFYYLIEKISTFKENIKYLKLV